jgi:hypothetical protein
MMPGGRVTSILIGALALAGCGGSGPTSPEMWCGGLCSAVRRCEFEESTCVSECVAQNPQLAKESTRGAAAEEPCIAKNLSCQAIDGDDTAWKNDLDACWQQAKTTVDITPHVRQVCAKDATAWFNCGSAFSIDDCQRDYAMWADDVLDRLAACQAISSCDGFQGCEKVVFGGS